MNPITHCYRSAAEALTAAAQRLGFADLPEPVPLRLRTDTGTLASGLAPALAGRGDAAALAGRLAGALTLEDTPFDRGEAQGKLVLLHISPRWLRETAETLAAAPSSPLPPMEQGSRDRNDLRFLLSYTARRCRTLAERPGPRAELPPDLVLRLASAPGDREGERGLMLAYWSLPPDERRDAALAGAVSRRAAKDYDRFFR